MREKESSAAPRTWAGLAAESRNAARALFVEVAATVETTSEMRGRNES
jgi:hypothetical protein